MNSTRFWVIVASAFLAVCIFGCAHRPSPEAAQGGSVCTVSLPPLILADGESIQSVDFTVTDGRIATINRTWDDWDTALRWDDPRHLVLEFQARHFVSGFTSTRKFDRLFSVQPGSLSHESSERPRFDITATVHTDSTDSTGRGKREYNFSRSELILSPRPDISVWRTRDPFDPGREPGKYIVQWGYSALEIARHFRVAVGQLELLNPGVDLSCLKVGQVLVVSEPARK